MDIVQAAGSPILFKAWFRKTSWGAWFSFLRVLFGLALSKTDIDTMMKCTGRTRVPVRPFKEAWLICGRRGGKSFILALIAVYLACFKDYRQYLQPGERATVMIIAADRKQARIIFRYVSGLINNIPMLRKRKAGREAADGFDLVKDVTIEIHTASFRSTRGYTIVAALLDEIAFWRDESSANPDREIIDAIRPGMATIPNAFLLCASSPYARKGVLWETYKRYWAQNQNDILVWKAATEVMNPSISKSFLARQFERDPASASAEYGAEFRSDVETLLSPEALEAVTISDRRELMPSEFIRYVAFVDPSGGSQDSFTLGIAHCERETRTVIVDCIRETKPPFSPEAVVSDYAAVMKSYNVALVHGDRYAGEWPREQFAKRGIRYEVCEKTKSDLYRDLVPVITAGKCELLDIPVVKTQLASLERRVSRAGKDLIDHPPKMHDDVANCVAGVISFAAPKLELWDESMIFIGERMASADFYDERDRRQGNFSRW